MTLTGTKHLVVVPFEAWGHVRPLLHLTVQLLALHPKLHITHLLSPTVAPRVKAELASSGFAYVYETDLSGKDSVGTSSVLDRIQLIEVQVAPNSDGIAGEPAPPKKGDLVEGLAAGAAPYAAAIAGCFSVLFGNAGGQGGAADIDNKFKDIVPTCVVYDMFQAFVLDTLTTVTRSQLGKTVPCFAFVPSGPTAILHHYAREDDGGFLEAMKRIVEAGVAKGGNALELVNPLGFGDRGVMKSLPGLPTMTDFELHPGVGSCPPPPPIVLSLFDTYKATWSPQFTGFVAPNVQEMEPEAIKWLEAHLGKPFLSLGFQYSEKVWEGEIVALNNEDSDGLRAVGFLDQMLEHRGPKSVIYISYGSAFFPITRPDLVHHLLDTLLSTSTPFLFAYATELFPIPADLLDKVKDAQFGMAVHVAPQVQVLHHPATGFFLSHCGMNSMAEAIVAGVPIIGMPFFADQGEHIEILKRYKAGVDLKQVKCFFGQGEKPEVLYDGTRLIGTPEAIRTEMVDLWSQLQGKLGQELYEGMAALRQMCEKSCREGGASRQAMMDFAKYL